MSQSIIDNFKLHFPRLFEKAVNYEINDEHEAVIFLNDNTSILYDEIDNTYRKLPSDRNNMTEEECRNEFGMRLYKIMISRGLTEAELSERTGIPQNRISGYITGKNTPSFYKVDKIAKALGCSIEEFRYV